MDTNYIIETKNLTKQYGSQKSVADLNIHVKRGRIYGLLGRNGAGKTTTMKMLLGLTKPTSGEVKIWGKSLQGNEKKLLPRIGSLIESPGFYPNLTATENLRIFATLRGVPNSHADKIKIVLSKKENNMELLLADNGVGIEKEDLKHIFERLYKCDKGRSEKGSGPGLSIVHQLVEKMGGSITVESLPGKGTEFMLLFPLEI